jgi:hypothetical protein
LHVHLLLIPLLVVSASALQYEKPSDFEQVLLHYIGNCARLHGGFAQFGRVIAADNESAGSIRIAIRMASG